MDKYLDRTKILDYDNPLVIQLIARKKWRSLPLKDRISGIYDFVRNEIPFGFNKSDNISASEVLKDGYGQCNTKSTLFMALLRATGVPCRFHGFAIHKKLQKGLINGLAFSLAPKEILHSWIEINYEGRWYNAEGLILDDSYLKGLRIKIGDKAGPLCGYGVDVKNFQLLQNEWNVCDTYIQKEGIIKNYGLFDSPDEFYSKIGTNLSVIKKIIYRMFVRKIMNKNVNKIRL